ncbi:MAG: FAD-dependent oxidoreductase, partial [Usitatibacter sp.]
MTGRRTFIGAGAALLATACTRGAPPEPSGEMLSTNYRLGHRLRDGGLEAPGERRSAKVVIVGAGIAGLSAAWRLRRAGFTDFEMLELEDAPGGNARWGENEVSAYPWGAHYIPLPTREARATRILLAELGVLLGDPHAAVPRYEERMLVHAPHERLYRNGTWSDGLAPLEGRSAAEVDDWHRFQA